MASRSPKKMIFFYSFLYYLDPHHVDHHNHNHHHQVLGGWRLGSDGSSQKGDAYFCGGGNATTVPDIYGETKSEMTKLEHAVAIC